MMYSLCTIQTWQKYGTLKLHWINLMKTYVLEEVLPKNQTHDKKLVKTKMRPFHDLRI